MSPAALLALAGRHGPALLFGSVLLGLAVPALAAAARPLMDGAVFCFTLGAFLKVDLAAFRAEAGPTKAWRNAAILAWSSFGVPLVVWALVHLLRPAPDLAEGLLLCTVAPPVGSAAALAAMLGLNAPLALLASVVATIAAPFTMPVLAEALAGHAMRLDASAMALRLLVIVGGACLVSWLMRRYAGRYVLDNPLAMTGVAVVALVVFALGAMHGMQAHFAQQPGVVALHLVLAFLVNAGLQLLGALLFARAGLGVAATVGLVSGNRNIGLAWAAVGSGMPPVVELYFAMSVLPIYMLPALAKRLLAFAPDASCLPADTVTAPRAATWIASVGSAAAVRRQAAAGAAACRTNIQCGSHDHLGTALGPGVPLTAIETAPRGSCRAAE